MTLPARNKMDVFLHNEQYAAPVFDDSRLVPGLEAAAGSSNRIKIPPKENLGGIFYSLIFT